MTMAKHAKLSPSASSRWMPCPGSVRLIDALNLPPEGSNKYADEGTAAHSLGEICLENNLNAEDYLGKKAKQFDFSLKNHPAGEFKVTANMAEAVQVYIDYIRCIIEESNDFDIETQMDLEVWCPLDYLGVPGLDGGTSDCILSQTDGTLHVIDYKHGQGVAVDAENNTQALHYAAGALHRMTDPGYVEGPSDIREVIITIVQPRAHHEDGPVRSWAVSPEYVQDWIGDALLPQARAVHEPDAPLVAGEKQCRFCRASGNCSAQMAATQAMAKADFADISTTVMPDIESLTSRQKLQIMSHAKMLNKFISDVETHVLHEIDNGSSEYTDHYKLVRKKTNRKLIDFDDVCVAVGEAGLCSPQFFNEKLKPLTEIEKIIKSEMDKKEAQELMKKITTKPEGGVTLAPLNDKREEVQPTAVTDFDHL